MTSPVATLHTYIYIFIFFSSTCRRHGPGSPWLAAQIANPEEVAVAGRQPQEAVPSLSAPLQVPGGGVA